MSNDFEFDPFGDDPDLVLYNSYTDSPPWQRTFTWTWLAVLGGAVLLSLPASIRAIRTRRAFRDFWGVREIWSVDATTEKDAAVPLKTSRTPPRSTLAPLYGVFTTLFSVLRFTIPFVELNVGQLVVLVAYLALLIICSIHNVPLHENANRPGFIALAQLPPLFLLATKNSLLSLLLFPGGGKGYESLNWLHKALGRGVFLATAIHGGSWIKDHLRWGNPILGQMKETSGVAAFGVMCVIVISSIRPIRERFYQAFFIVHVLAFPAFFITVCVHTPYAAPWIYAPVALYGLDLALRLIRLRIKDAILVPASAENPGSMTLIHVQNVDEGWRAGQHVRLRVFSGGRVFESHPLSVLSAPRARSVYTEELLGRGTMTLAARACGDWSRALAELARPASSSSSAALSTSAGSSRSTNMGMAMDDCDPTESSPLLPGGGRHVQVMLDGPYGGCSLDLGAYEDVLLVAGGSGMTFVLGVLDDLVGRIVNGGREHGERTRRVEVKWCIRSFGAIYWFAPYLDALARAAARLPQHEFDLHIAVYVTCLCDPEAVPDIPNSVVTIERPSARGMVERFVRGATAGSSADTGADGEKGTMGAVGTMGGRTIGAEDVDVDMVEVERLPPPAPTTNEKIDAGLPAASASTAQGYKAQGGVAVCVAGPASLAREVSNAVALVGTTAGFGVGGIGLHAEVYAL